MVSFKNLRGSNSAWLWAHNQAEFDPRKFLKETMVAMQQICEDRYNAFGTAGNADKIKVVSLENMAAKYGM